MIKKLMLCFLIMLILSLGSDMAHCISVAGGLISSGQLLTDSHQHVTTVPSKIYSITITPVSDGLVFAQILSTRGAAPDSATYVSNGIPVIDVQAVTIGESRQYVFPDGIKCGGNMFVDIQNATAEIHYKQ